jgi:hypothetical protein
MYICGGAPLRPAATATTASADSMRLVPLQYYYGTPPTSTAPIGVPPPATRVCWDEAPRRPPPANDDEASGTVFGVLACVLFMALLLLALSYPGSSFYNHYYYPDRYGGLSSPYAAASAWLPLLRTQQLQGAS